MGIHKLRGVIVVLALASGAGCSLAPAANGEGARQVVWQNSPTIGLLNGLYDGLTDVAEVRNHGDLGLGTWDRLNGEGLIIDGVFYQIHSDGSVHVMPDSAKLPWVSVTHFAPESEQPLPPGLTFADLPAVVDPTLPTVNTYYAIRIDGEFDLVETRSLPEQNKPYPPFCKVEETEPKFAFVGVKGTMVGFRSPPFSTNMSVPNWHLHFLAANDAGGGHVLKFKVASATMKIDRVDDVDIQIPTTEAYDRADLTSIIQCN